MQLDKIQRRALKTWYPVGHELHLDPLHPTLAIAGEAGELADQLKKHLWKPGVTVSRQEFLDELGDLLYYVAIRAYQLGVTLDELSRMNRKKLENGRHGWPEGAEGL
jgi:NTP pyrophosphatase (non-canonical NTP hydrolase)